MCKKGKISQVPKALNKEKVNEVFEFKNGVATVAGKPYSGQKELAGATLSFENGRLVKATKNGTYKQYKYSEDGEYSIDVANISAHRFDKFKIKTNDKQKIIEIRRRDSKCPEVITLENIDGKWIMVSKKVPHEFDELGNIINYKLIKGGEEENLPYIIRKKSVSSQGVETTKVYRYGELEQMIEVSNINQNGVKVECRVVRDAENKFVSKQETYVDQRGIDTIKEFNEEGSLIASTKDRKAKNLNFAPECWVKQETIYGDEFTECTQYYEKHSKNIERIVTKKSIDPNINTFEKTIIFKDNKEVKIQVIAIDSGKVINEKSAERDIFDLV